MFFYNNDFGVDITFPSPYNQYAYAMQKVDTKLHAVAESLARQQTPVHACVKGLTFTVTYTVPFGRFPHDSTRCAWNLLASQLDTCGYSGSRLQVIIRLLGVTGTDYVDQTVLGLQLDALRHRLRAWGFDVSENAEVESCWSGRFRVMKCDMGTDL